MIAVLQLVLIGVPASLAILASIRVVRAWLSIAQLVQRSTTPIAELVEGPVEIEGTIRVCEEPIVAPSGVRCAAVTVHATRVEVRDNGKRVIHGTTSVTRVASCTVEDGHGGRVRVEADGNVSLQGEAFVSGELAVGELPDAWAALAKPPALHVLVEEHRIEDGAHVVVHGVAEPTEGESAAYRVGTAMRIVSPAESPMLILRGAERVVRRRGMIVAASMTVLTALLGDIAYQVMAIMR